MTERFTRREFLKIATGTAASLFFSSQLVSESGEVPRFPGNTILFDFAPEHYSPEIHNYVTQRFYPDNERELQRLLGNDYLPYPILLWKYREYLHDRKKLEEQLLHDAPRFALAKGALNLFQDHGVRVAKAMHVLESSARRRSVDKPLLYPLQPMLEKADLLFDEKGNPGLRTKLNIQKMAHILKHQPGYEIGNLSWILGNNDIYYVVNGLSTEQRKVFGARGFMDIDQMSAEEKSLLLPVRYTLEPKLRIISGNSPGRVAQTAQDIFQLSEALPLKEFNLAGGNHGDDLIDVRNTCNERWPKYIRVCAEWMPLDENRGKPAQNMHGADIYVDNAAFRQPPGSSFSTAIITQASSMLREAGYTTFQERNQILQECSDKTIYTTVRNHRRETLEATVFNPTKFFAFISP